MSEQSHLTEQILKLMDAPKEAVTYLNSLKYPVYVNSYIEADSPLKKWIKQWDLTRIHFLGTGYEFQLSYDTGLETILKIFDTDLNLECHKIMRNGKILKEFEYHPNGQIKRQYDSGYGKITEEYVYHENGLLKSYMAQTWREFKQEYVYEYDFTEYRMVSESVYINGKLTSVTDFHKNGKVAMLKTKYHVKYFNDWGVLTQESKLSWWDRLFGTNFLW